jgi:hypothetical protein
MLFLWTHAVLLPGCWSLAGTCKLPLCRLSHDRKCTSVYTSYFVVCCPSCTEVRYIRHFAKPQLPLLRSTYTGTYVCTGKI